MVLVEITPLPIRTFDILIDRIRFCFQHSINLNTSYENNFASFQLDRVEVFAIVRLQTQRKSSSIEIEVKFAYAYKKSQPRKIDPRVLEL